jgi:hypothetical protein
MRSQIEMVEELSDYRKEGESEACPKHGLVQADLVTV